MHKAARFRGLADIHRTPGHVWGLGLPRVFGSWPDPKGVDLAPVRRWEHVQRVTVCVLEEALAFTQVSHDRF
jgi:hypothetical protein